MEKPKKHKGGRKNRKFGRWSRAPSMRIYQATGRGERNKARRIEKHRRAVFRARDRRAEREQE